MCVVERRAVVGGAAVTEEFHPGFRNSTASYTVSLLDPQVIRDLRLAEHGLSISERPFANFLPLPDGRVSRGRRRSSRHAVRGREILARATPIALPPYYAMLERVAAALRGDSGRRRRRTSGPGARRISRRDRSNCSRSAGASARMSLPERRDVLTLFTQSAGDDARPMVRERADQGGRSASMRWSAISRARTRPARRTCCCITCSAR